MYSNLIKYDTFDYIFVLSFLIVLRKLISSVIDLINTYLEVCSSLFFCFHIQYKPLLVKFCCSSFPTPAHTSQIFFSYKLFLSKCSRSNLLSVSFILSSFTCLQFTSIHFRLLHCFFFQSHCNFWVALPLPSKHLNIIFHLYYIFVYNFSHVTYVSYFNYNFHNLMTSLLFSSSCHSFRKFLFHHFTLASHGSFWLIMYDFD